MPSWCRYPVVTTLAGKSAFPEDHPLAAGTLANTSADPAIQLLDEADLVFGIGASFSKMPLSTPIPAGKVLVQQTIDPADLNKEYAVDHTLLGDAQLVLRQLSAAVKEQVGPDGSGGADGCRGDRGATQSGLACQVAAAPHRR